MKDAAEPSSANATSFHLALLDYFSAPGKYQLSLRQPSILFGSIREVLQLAAGRGSGDGMPVAESARLTEAAAFFIRAALLYPGADHYAVLGYAPRSEPVELKERYRLMMRLTHPDFVPAGSAAWPADAAVRVNRAYEVLSSSVLRKEYDEQLGSLQAQRAAEAPVPKTRPVPRPRPEATGWSVNPRAAWALAAGLVILGGLMLWPAPEPVDLVQRLPASSVARSGQVVPAPADPEPTPPVELVPSELASAVRPAESLPQASTPVPAAPSLPQPEVSLQERPAPVPPASLAAAATPRVAVVPPPVAAAPLPPPAAAPSPAAVPVRPLESPAPAARARLDSQVPAVRPGPPAPPLLAPVPAKAQDPAPSVIARVELQPAPKSEPAPPARPLTVAAAATQVPSPTLADAQPLLSQLLQMLESGSGHQVLRLLESDARQSPSAQALSSQYDQLVRGARPVRLSQVEFKGEPREGGVLLVTGRIRLHAGEPTIGSHGERFLVRAEFVSRGGRVMLTGLSGASD